MEMTDLPAARRINGYRGIWFELDLKYDYGARYSGGLGTYTANHQPAAVYCPEAEKTFFTYGGTTEADQRHLLVMASFFDHRTGELAKPWVVHDKEGVDDPHDNGSIQAAEDGHLWVFVSGRGTVRPGLIYRSLKPWDVSGFEKVAEQEITYPQIWKMPGQGFFLLFTKYAPGLLGSARELWWKTSPDGRAWSADFKLAGFGGHYQVSGSHGNKIATFFNWHPDSENNDRTNVYYLETSDGGETWTTADGTAVSLPLAHPDNPALVENCHPAGKRIYTCDLQFDAEGRPILLYIRSSHGNPGPGGDPREWVIARWTGCRWEQQVVTISSHNYDMGSLYSGREWRLIGPTETGPQPLGAGGEIALWTSLDEGRHWDRKIITRKSPYNHGYVRRPLGARDPFYAFWADGHTEHLSESRLYFCDSSGEKVMCMPYSMTDGKTKPEPLA